MNKPESGFFLGGPKLHFPSFSLLKKKRGEEEEEGKENGKFYNGVMGFGD